MSDITKAVIPASGHGTRMRPISNYIPKPMLPLGKQPILHHIVDELKMAGINEIAVVARTEHSAIWEYGKSTSGVHIIPDNSASGPGGAILSARDFVDGEEFVVLFSDAPMRGTNRENHLKQLCALKTNGEVAAVLSIYQIPQSEVSSRGVVAFQDDVTVENKSLKLTDIVEKPPSNDYPSRWASTCRYVLDDNIFDALDLVSSDDEELQLTSAIKYLIKKKQRVIGLPLPDHLKRYDTGNFEGYFEAFNDFVQ